ncbi:MAG: rfaE bifunctional protein kinase chain/domain [Marivirga sp.]|jgi:rfaE bifunctional protein kinase chain/domain
MSFKSTDAFFAAFADLKILVIGDVMIDSYIWGNVSRISPEAPVPVVNVKSKEKRLGGAANVALNLQSLGVKPILCAVIGQDESGQDLINLLAKREISDEGIVSSNDRMTTVKERVLAGSQHLLRIDTESLQALLAHEEEKLLARISSLIPSCDAIIFEDYDKGGITPSLISAVVTMAKAHHKPTIVDPKKNNFFDYKGVSLFKPNLKELQEGMHINFAKDDFKTLDEQVGKLLDTLSAQYVMTTLSEKGVIIKGAKTTHHIAAHKRSISDVSGAGDTVVSIAAICMALETGPEFTAALANLGGGIVCEELGVVPIQKARLLEEAKKHNLQP